MINSEYLNAFNTMGESGIYWVDLVFRFHRKSILHTPWHHRARKWECFFLLTRKKDFQAALESAEEAIRVHPGCLNAHQYRISVLFRNLNRKQEAKDAFLEMNRSAPYHPYTHRESLKFYPKGAK